MEEVGGEGGEEGGVEDEEGGDTGGGGSKGGEEGFVVVQAEVTGGEPDDGPFCLGLRCGGDGGGEAGESSEGGGGRKAAGAGAEGGLECLRAKREEGAAQEEGREEPDNHRGVSARLLVSV